jgi:hypothetical protein
MGPLRKDRSKVRPLTMRCTIAPIAPRELSRGWGGLTISQSSVYLRGGGGANAIGGGGGRLAHAHRGWSDSRQRGFVCM